MHGMQFRASVMDRSTGVAKARAVPPTVARAFGSSAGQASRRSTATSATTSSAAVTPAK
jgi:hypothetical protein